MPLAAPMAVLMAKANRSQRRMPISHRFTFDYPVTVNPVRAFPAKHENLLLFRLSICLHNEARMNMGPAHCCSNVSAEYNILSARASIEVFPRHEEANQP